MIRQRTVRVGLRRAITVTFTTMGLLTACLPPPEASGTSQAQVRAVVTP